MSQSQQPHYPTVFTFLKDQFANNNNVNPSNIRLHYLYKIHSNNNICLPVIFEQIVQHNLIENKHIMNQVQMNQLIVTLSFESFIKMVKRSTSPFLYDVPSIFHTVYPLHPDMITFNNQQFQLYGQQASSLQKKNKQNMDLANDVMISMYRLEQLPHPSLDGIFKKDYKNDHETPA